MKLLRALIALVLLVSIPVTSIASAQTASPMSPTTAGLAAQEFAIPSTPATVSVAATTDPAAPSLPTTEPGPVDTGGVIVTFEGSATPVEVRDVAKSVNTSAGSVEQVVPGTVTWKAPKGRSTAAFAAQLEKNPHVKAAAPNYIRRLVWTPPLFSSPNDPAFLSQLTDGYVTSKGAWLEKYPLAASWWLRAINAPSAWAGAYTGSNITGRYPLRADGDQIRVAVLDSGLYTSHPDVGVNIIPGHDYADGDSDVTPVDPSFMTRSLPYGDRVLEASHGTCVAGEIAATANNWTGVVGVGYSDTVVVVDKVAALQFDGTIGIPDNAVVDAMDAEIAAGAKVISMSFGESHNSSVLAAEINKAYNAGCVVVAAKGNDNSGAAFYPASNDHVVSVGALAKNAKGVTVPASYTNYTKTPLDIMAPGSFIAGLLKPDVDLDPSLPTGYFFWDGTSMAAPVVSGAIAWLWRAAPALSNAEITSEVLNSAAKGPASKRFPHGYRKLDMAAAYARLKADYPLLTKPAIADQKVASLGGVPVTWGVPLSKLRGVTYDVSWDGGPTTTTSDTGDSPGLSLGDHTVSVTAHSLYNWDDNMATSQKTIQVVPSADGSSTLGAGPTLFTPAYATWVAIDATLKDAAGTPLAGAPVTLQSSPDGIDFTDVGAETNLPGGAYRGVVSPTSRTWYRAAFAGSGGIVGSTSSPVVVWPQVSLSTPSSKSSVSHTSRFSVSGKLVPAHASSSRLVKLKVKRWNGHRWLDYSSVWTRVTLTWSGYSTYSAKLKLKKGAYRIYAFSGTDTMHWATTSGYKAVAVK